MKQVLEWPSKVPIKVTEPSDVVAETDPLSLHFLGQVNTDPVAPTVEESWVLRSGTVTGGGDPLGLLLCITNAGSISGLSYQFSFRTLEGTTKRVTIA